MKLTGAFLLATATNALVDGPWSDKSSPPKQRAQALVANMTLDEKLVMVSVCVCAYVCGCCVCVRVCVCVGVGALLLCLILRAFSSASWPTNWSLLSMQNRSYLRVRW